MDTDFQLLIDKTLSPSAQSKLIAQFALNTLADAENSNGHLAYVKYVDGAEGADESSVRPSGSIVYEFDVVSSVLLFIGQTLEMNSPTGDDNHPGQYKASHRLFADDIEVTIGGSIPTASVYTFVSMLPYSEKIERGESSQAPGGVYEITAQQALTKFGGNIRFIDYAASDGNTMHNTMNIYPSIQVTV